MKGLYDHRLPVVIKRVISPLDADEKHKQDIQHRVLREAEISNLASQSHHPNVVTFIGVEDYFEKGEKKRVGLVYKFMSGGSLDEVIRGRREYLSNKRSDVLMVMSIA